MHRLFYFLAVMAFAALGVEESKEKPNPLLSLERLYGKPEFSAKSYGVKWLEAGQGYVRLEKSKATKEARDIVRLKFVEELSYKEISERMGLKVGNVGYKLHHALKQLAFELQQNGVTP